MAINMCGPAFAKCMDAALADARKWLADYYDRPENATRLAKEWAEIERQRKLMALVGQSI